jgi:hypothetical protein
MDITRGRDEVVGCGLEDGRGFNCSPGERCLKDVLILAVRANQVAVQHLASNVDRVMMQHEVLIPQITAHQHSPFRHTPNRSGLRPFAASVTDKRLFCHPRVSSV